MQMSSHFNFFSKFKSDVRERERERETARETGRETHDIRMCLNCVTCVKLMLAKVSEKDASLEARGKEG